MFMKFQVLPNSEYEVEYDNNARKTLGSLLPEPAPPVKKKRGRPRKTLNQMPRKRKS